jgi:DNA polymerase III subunit gamma/tau
MQVLHQSLARKWRPKYFSEVIGQDRITKTLSQAIQIGAIHPAYIFSGSRGVGKTSVARIFAKSIRCLALESSNALVRACGTCAPCQDAERASLDIFEIDGASCNGVDAIRELQEQMMYVPSTGKQKIYIIDEVHMLSTAAFNALLKTLEEPPPHVVFIFATTEPHKIPATIYSRAQAFPFQRVLMQAIETRLQWIVKEEGKKVTSEAIMVLARASDGSVRDALSLLDQALSFEPEGVTADGIRSLMGWTKAEVLIGLVDGMARRDLSKVLQLSDETHEKGLDLRLMVRGLLEVLHVLILMRAQGGALGVKEQASLGLMPHECTELERMAPLRTLEEWQLFFQVFHHAFDHLARSVAPKCFLDVCLVKCTCGQAWVDTEGTSYAPVSTPISQPASTPSRPKELRSKGQHFLDILKRDSPLVYAMVEHGRLEQEKEDTWSLSFLAQAEGYYHHLQQAFCQEAIQKAMEGAFGVPTPLKIELKAAGGPSLAEERERQALTKKQAREEKILKDPWLQEAQTLFGVSIQTIKLKDED